ncbi:MAG: hypothetical protein OEY52_06330 [Gammaproteobacteria bacterium]|nr:hypothetical protein [Gammaproteobacteria bacterium]
MMKKISLLFLVAIVFSPSIFAAPGLNMAMQLRGTATGYDGTVPDIDGDGIDDPATCFDVEVFNVATGLKMGDGTDCLSNITPVGGGLRIVGTTYFKLPSGTLVTRGITSVQPKTGGSESITHITGAIPGSGDNSVIAGDGAFKGVSGPVRLSGAVDMSQVDSGIISFDCLFIASLSKNK